MQAIDTETVAATATKKQKAIVDIVVDVDEEIKLRDKQLSKNLVDAIGRNDLSEAREALLSKINIEVNGRNSWDSAQYTGDRELQSKIVMDHSRDDLLTYFGVETLRDRYFLKDYDGVCVENPQKFFARVATGIARGDVKFAQKLYDIISRLWFMPATPVLVNSATTKGAPISCFLNVVGDSITDIFKTFEENAFLAKGGGGIGTNWSEVRGHSARMKNGGRSSGTIPFLKIMDSATLAVNQGGVRRGAAAAYMRIDHPDIEEFLTIRKPTGGDDNRKCLNLHHGIIITDKFMKAVAAGESFELLCPHSREVTGTVDAYSLWKKLLTLRIETGEPYLLFIDTVNKAVPEHHKEKGLFVSQSNLCSEITLPTNRDRTAVCCLGSMNLETWDEWEDKKDEVVALAVRALDNVIDNFIDYVDGRDYKRAIASAKNERSIGLGVMGYHGLLMKKMIPWEGVAARSLNKIVFKGINEAAVQASKDLAKERGPCPDGGEQRNSYVMAIAPTANISVICGGCTPCVEPTAGNAYLQKTLSGSFLVKNRYLRELLRSKGLNSSELWRKIIEAKGSVQHLDELTDEEKAVFKTGYELNQHEIVQQAADRQKYICQSQSLNLFFETPVSGKLLSSVHMKAYELGVKSLYYLRSSSAIHADNIDSTSVRRQVGNDIKNPNDGAECSVCQ